MKIAIYSRTLEATPGPPTAMLDRVQGLGLDGCLFGSVLDVSRTLDPGELHAIRDEAAARGLYLDGMFGQINPYHFTARKDVLAAGDGDFRTGLERIVLAARELGLTSLFFTVGALVDRFSRSVPWADQLAATRAFLAEIRPFLLDNGFRLDVKTHEEITSDETVEMVEAVGADVVGIGLDPVNVVVRLEDPLEAARRTLPYLRRVFLSDCDLFFTEQGIVRKLRAVGDGVIDWTGIQEIINAAGATPAYTVELHRGQFGMPIFDAAWMNAEPSIRMAELAEVVRLTVAAEEKLKQPDRPPREAFQADPLTRLQATLDYLPVLFPARQQTAVPA